MYNSNIKGGAWRTGRTLMRLAAACTAAVLMMTVPAAACTAGVISAAESEESTGWSDYMDHWARGYIDTVIEKGYMSASGPYFAPEAPMTRAMFVQALAAVAGVEDYGKGSNEWGTQAELPYEPDMEALAAQFTDIDVNASYAKAAAWAFEKGIVNGLGDGSFGPDEAINRETLAVMIYRAVDALGVQFEEDWSMMMDYDDLDQVSDWALEGIAYCAATGLMQGNDDGNFAPKRTLTRAEGAVVITRFAVDAGVLTA